MCEPCSTNRSCDRSNHLDASKIAVLSVLVSRYRVATQMVHGILPSSGGHVFGSRRAFEQGDGYNSP